MSFFHIQESIVSEFHKILCFQSSLGGSGVLEATQKTKF